MSLNIGFIGTRFAGLDGVSLETNKWVEVLKESGHKIFWFAGELDIEGGESYLVPEAFFQYPENLEINKYLFGKRTRPREITNRINDYKNYLKDRIYEFIKRYKINLIIAENCLAIPVHVPLGIALTEIIQETGILTIAHHHDFYWERKRFLVNSIGDYLEMSFPPDLPFIKHVVINSIAQKELAARRGISSIVIPNVINFDKSPTLYDDFNKDLREQLGFSKDDILFLQPTRIVARKGIEQAISLVARLNNPKIKLIISHSSGDEGMDYFMWLKELISQLNVPVYFISNKLHEKRKVYPDGKKVYSLWDLYPHVDFITYPSLFEGFGNAFLEAIYFKKPLLVNRYQIFVTDIEPKGFKVVAFDGYLSEETINEVKKILQDKKYREEIVNHNYEVAKKYFSYDILRKKLNSILTEFYGELN